MWGIAEWGGHGGVTPPPPRARALPYARRRTTRHAPIDAPPPHASTRPQAPSPTPPPALGHALPRAVALGPPAHTRQDNTHDPTPRVLTGISLFWFGPPAITSGPCGRCARRSASCRRSHARGALREDGAALRPRRSDAGRVGGARECAEAAGHGAAALAQPPGAPGLGHAALHRGILSKAADQSGAPGPEVASGD